MRFKKSISEDIEVAVIYHGGRSDELVITIWDELCEAYVNLTLSEVSDIYKHVCDARAQIESRLCENGTHEGKH